VPKMPFGYYSEFPEEVRPIFQSLCEDLASANSKWHLYLDLFSREEDVAILNEAASGAFQIIEESLRSDMIMAFCRLCDPERSCGYENISLEKLAEDFKHVDGLQRLLDDFQASCEPVVAHRNKRIAHNDLKATLQPHDEPLPSVSPQIINAILEAAAKMMNHILGVYLDVEIAFEQTITFGTGKHLIQCLKYAQKYFEEKEGRAPRKDKP
jgi:hypothetical protein